jgi:hypothetical protein
MVCPKPWRVLFPVTDPLLFPPEGEAGNRLKADPLEPNRVEATVVSSMGLSVPLLVEANNWGDDLQSEDEVLGSQDKDFWLKYIPASHKRVIFSYLVTMSPDMSPPRDL